MRIIFLTILVFSLHLSPVSADQEASSVPYVKSAEYGRCYAKAVPESPHDRTKGTTRIYRVTESQDQLIQSYDWYSQDVRLWCIGPATEAAVVRLGPWNRGRQANAEHLSIAFYYGSKGLLKKYSTLEIAGGTPLNVSNSVSHYTVIKNIVGFRRVEPNNAIFEVQTIDDRRISFDVSTGKIVSIQSLDKTAGK